MIGINNKEDEYKNIKGETYNKIKMQFKNAKKSFEYSNK